MSQPFTEVVTLSHPGGLELRAMGYGGIILSLRTPDRLGRLGDIVLGFDAPSRYEDDHPYFGAIVGRYANRIARGRFALDGRPHSLATNDGSNHLHGGRRGFDRHAWSIERPAPASVTFTRISPAGEEGYPGTLSARVTYALTAAGELIVEYCATADRATPVNLTQHSYFNLAGEGSILGHDLWIDADRYLPVDATSIPTGELAAVDGTPFDFRRPAAIGARIGDPHPQLHRARGYDHTWVLNRGAGLTRPSVRLHDPSSGRTMAIATDQPGIQLYSGNLLDGSIAGKGGRHYQQHAGLCLETQHFPDSPNHPHFPSTILEPGREYRTKTVFTFGVAK